MKTELAEDSQSRFAEDSLSRHMKVSPIFKISTLRIQTVFTFKIHPFRREKSILKWNGETEAQLTFLTHTKLDTAHFLMKALK